MLAETQGGTPSSVANESSHTVEVNGLSIELLESGRFIYPGNCIWPISRSVCAYLESIRSEIQGKVVLDMGSGTGVVGLFAARCGASQVIISDLPPLVELMETNARTNGLHHEQGGPVYVEAFNWDDGPEAGGVIESLGGKVDFVVASDILYATMYSHNTTDNDAGGFKNVGSGTEVEALIQTGFPALAEHWVRWMDGGAQLIFANEERVPLQPLFRGLQAHGVRWRQVDGFEFDVVDPELLRCKRCVHCWKKGAAHSSKPAFAAAQERQEEHDGGGCLPPVDSEEALASQWPFNGSEDICKALRIDFKSRPVTMLLFDDEERALPASAPSSGISACEVVLAQLLTKPQGWALLNPSGPEPDKSQLQVWPPRAQVLDVAVGGGRAAVLLCTVLRAAPMFRIVGAGGRSVGEAEPGVCDAVVADVTGMDEDSLEALLTGTDGARMRDVHLLLAHMPDELITGYSDLLVEVFSAQGFTVTPLELLMKTPYAECDLVQVCLCRPDTTFN
jgi:hypothetical protein